jgi:enamine deaminase RidA (YjgF/YER057c/UK114 family)
MITRYTRTAIMHRVVEHGDTLYFGGIVAEDHSASMKGQTEQVLARLGQLLDEVGSNKSKVLSVTVFVTDMAQKAVMNEAWTTWFGAENLPARATVGVASLGTDDTLIEIVAIAAR